MDINRRKFLELLGLGAASAIGATLSTPLGIRPASSMSAELGSLPLPSSTFPDLEQQTSPILTLATSLPQEYAYAVQIEGRIPKQLQGILYRNGPGLFDRGQSRKRHLLDGDGLIQSFRIWDGRVFYRNRFVRTTKYLKETAMNKFLLDTWSTLVPGGETQEEFRGQAGVTIFFRNGKLYAFDDENGPPWELNPLTLRTVGASRLGLPEELPYDFEAHSKIDGQTDDWTLFTISQDKRTYNIVTLNPNGSFKQQQAVQMPRFTHLHDYFVTNQYVVFNLHPMEIEVQRIGQRESSFIEAMRWRPEQGNILVVVDRSGQTSPIQLTTDAAWMWHALNAYEANGEIIADFVGYDNPDHFVGSDPVLASLMRGHQSEQKFPGTIRRYIINLASQTVYQEIINDANHDFPFVNQRHSCHKHRFGYFTNGILPTGIKRVDVQNGDSQGYEFGEGIYCFEPVFAPLPGFDYTADLSVEPGWLLVEGLNGLTKRGFLAIFAADRVSDGPIAIAHLLHHVPYNFHGYWQGMP